MLAFQNKGGKYKSILFPVLCIISIWVIFILPSCFHPNWSYLDDPTTLLMGKKLAADFHVPKPDGTSGRYFPAYWLYYAALYRLFDYNLTGYYIAQSLMFLLTLLLAYFVVIKITQSSLSGIFAAFLVATASPVAENLYTFGKAEPKILFYLLCILSMFIVLLDKKSHQHRFFRATSWFGIIGLMFVALLTKETASAFIVFAAGGFVTTYLLRKKEHFSDGGTVQQYLLLLCGLLCSLIFARGLFFMLGSSSNSSTYTTYSITRELITNNLKFYFTQQPDVIFFGLMSIILIVMLYIWRAMPPKSLVIAFALFLTGLAYITGHLIWRWALGYYLLVPATLFSLSVAISLPFLKHTTKYKGVLYVSLALILLTRIYSLTYASYIAKAQSAQDKIFTEAINNYIHKANPGERLIVENWPFFVEPVTQSNILIKQLFEKDQFQVEGIKDILENMTIPEETLKLYSVAKTPDKTRRWPKPNDYVLKLTGNVQSPWILRGVSPFVDENQSAFKKQGLRLEKVAGSKVNWKGLRLIPYFNLPRIQDYSTGYNLYKVRDPLPTLLWEGRWDDKWISKKGICSLRANSHNREFFFIGHAEKYTLPTFLIVKQGNTVMKVVSIDKAGRFSFLLRLKPQKDNGLAKIEFSTEKTFNPKQLGLSDDTRDLSVQLQLSSESEM